MAFQDYWSLLCPYAIEKGLNVGLEPNMAQNPNYLNFFKNADDPVLFQPIFNCPEDFGEPGPHIGVCMFDEKKQVPDYLQYILNQTSVEKGAEKTWIEEIHAFKAYIWKPMAYDLETTDWSVIPEASINEWLNWHLHYLGQLTTLFFHEQNE